MQRAKQLLLLLLIAIYYMKTKPGGSIDNQGTDTGRHNHALDGKPCRNVENKRHTPFPLSIAQDANFYRGRKDKGHKQYIVLATAWTMLFYPH